MDSLYQHQAMGYDRASTMFSPDGRILQVEYAKKTIKQGSLAIGFVYDKGIILAAHKRNSSKLLKNTGDKIAKIDEHIGISSVGIIADGRILIEKAQVLAQQHRVTYNAKIPILNLIKDLSNTIQSFTQYGGVRPYGVSLILATHNKKTQSLFIVDPSGTYNEYFAYAIGKDSEEINKKLEKDYKTMKEADAIKYVKDLLSKEKPQDLKIESQPIY